MRSKKGNTWLSLLINIVAPAVILIRFSGDDYFGPVLGLIAALLFPLIYGAFSLLKSKRVDYVAIIGLIGVLLTGGIGLFKLDPKWLAIKEASVPLLIAVVILLSERTKYPIVQNLLNKIIDNKKIEALLSSEAKTKYNRRLKLTTYIIVSSFVLSAVLNFVLAKVLVKSQPGTEAFNAELGRMTALSYPIIAVPSLILLVAAVVYLISGIEKFAEVEIEDILMTHP